MAESTNINTDADSGRSVHHAASIGSIVTGSSGSSRSRNTDGNSNHIRETGSQNVSIPSKVEAIQFSGSPSSGEGSLGKAPVSDQRANGVAGTANGADYHQERQYVHPPQNGQYMQPGKPQKQHNPVPAAQQGHPVLYQGIQTYSGPQMGQAAPNQMLFNRNFAQGVHSGHQLQGMNFQQQGNNQYVPRLEKLVPGTVLGVGSHHATIIGFIGQGGFSHIYSVRMDPPEDNLSIACLKRVIVPNKQGLNRLRAEVDVMRRLSKCETAVKYYDSNAAHIPGSPGMYEVLLLMELCENNSLLDYMNQHLSTRLTETEISSIMLDVCKAVYEMHRAKIIHRDIKIENVLIDKEYRFKLCDFGSACPVLPPPKDVSGFKALQNDIIHQTTPQYRSPEMIDLYRGYPIDEKSDIWALGVFLYKLCYYTTPFEVVGELGLLHSAYEMPAKPVYSGQIRHLIGLMLQEDPEFRPNIYQVLLQVADIAHIDPSKLEVEDIYGQGGYSEPQGGAGATIVDHMMPFMASRRPIRSYFQRDFDDSLIGQSTNPFLTGGNQRGVGEGTIGSGKSGKSLSGKSLSGKSLSENNNLTENEKNSIQRNETDKSSIANATAKTSLHRKASEEKVAVLQTLPTTSSTKLEPLPLNNSSLSISSARSSVSSQASSTKLSVEAQKATSNPFRKPQTQQSTNQNVGNLNIDQIADQISDETMNKTAEQKAEWKPNKSVDPVPSVKITGAKSEVQTSTDLSAGEQTDQSLLNVAPIDAQSTSASTSTDSLVDNVEERFPDILSGPKDTKPEQKRWSTHNPFPNISNEHLRGGAVLETDGSNIKIPEREEELAKGIDLIDLTNRSGRSEEGSKQDNAPIPKKVGSMNPFDL